ncbi:hypothetical protein M8818_002369 [Zalaria obscura]|uniref:Uncharacterized protein n=1 Tax=Zalaria obscura TaxID=2024903 RepID=A0ACC3SI63_9PEZI
MQPSARPRDEQRTAAAAWTQQPWGFQTPQATYAPMWFWPRGKGAQQDAMPFEAAIVQWSPLLHAVLAALRPSDAQAPTLGFATDIPGFVPLCCSLTVVPAGNTISAAHPFAASHIRPTAHFYPIRQMVSVIALIGLVAFATAAIVVRKTRKYYALEQFRGPWSSGFSRLWLLHANASGEMHKYFTEVNDKYGATARVAPTMLLTKDPDLMRRMNAVRSSFVRSEWYTALRLHPDRDNITSVTDETVHADLRTRMAPGYSGKENLRMEDDIDDRLLELFGLIEKKYISTDKDFRPMDLSRTMSYFTLDVISSIAFGQAFGFIENDDDPFGYIANLQEFLPAIIVFGAYTELQKILRFPLLKPLLPKSTDKRGLGRVMGFARDRVQERFGEKPLVRKDMLQAFINRGMTKEQLESETLTQITAGSDSTASALRMTLHHITTTPACLDRLLSEARTAISRGQISRPVIRDAEARRLPYLQACIKEGLRIYPPVTGLLAKAVPPGGAELAPGLWAPGGTQIAWNSWAMMRDQGIFGVDAEVWRPERWLLRNGSQAEKERMEKMTETVGLVFGHGRFGCLGRGVAMMELNKGIIETLLRFDLQPCSLAKPFVEKCVGFFLHTEMSFRVTKRPEGEANGHPPDMDQHGGVAALGGAQDE